MSLYEIVLFFIYTIILILSILLVADVIRRVYKKRYYLKKDSYKREILCILSELVTSNDFSKINELSSYKPRKTYQLEAFWEVLEYIESKYRINQQLKETITLSLDLRDSLMIKLKSKNPIERGVAFRLVAVLNIQDLANTLFESLEYEKDVKVLLAGFIDLMSIIPQDMIEKLLRLLFLKYNQGLLSSRAVSLVISGILESFGEKVSNILFSQIQNLNNSELVIAILDGIYYGGYFDEYIYNIAVSNLNVENPEIISRSLKILSNMGVKLEVNILEKVISYLYHDKWFIRLSSLKVLENVISRSQTSTEIINKLIPLLSDQHAIIRQATAEILIKLPKEIFIDLLPKVFALSDQYAIDALVEAVSRSDKVGDFIPLILSYITENNQLIDKLGFRYHLTSGV